MAPNCLLNICLYSQTDGTDLIRETFLTVYGGEYRSMAVQGAQSNWWLSTESKADICNTSSTAQVASPKNEGARRQGEGLCNDLFRKMDVYSCLSPKTTMYLESWSYCLCLPSAGVTGMHYHILPKIWGSGMPSASNQEQQLHHRLSLLPMPLLWLLY